MYKEYFCRFLLLVMVFGVFLPSVINNWGDGIVIVGSCIATAIAIHPLRKY